MEVGKEGAREDGTGCKRDGGKRERGKGETGRREGRERRGKKREGMCPCQGASMRTPKARLHLQGYVCVRVGACAHSCVCVRAGAHGRARDRVLAGVYAYMYIGTGRKQCTV